MSGLVYVDADVQVRCEGRNYVMRIITAKWKWDDKIDANAYPDISWNTSEWHWLEDFVHNNVQPPTGFDFDVTVNFNEKWGKIVSVPRGN